MIDEIVYYVINNKEWIFSGVGLLAISLTAKFFLNNNKKKRNSVISQRSGDHSVNFQAQESISGVTIKKKKNTSKIK